MDDERLRQMLEALLIDRFQLKFHRESKNGTVYLLERNGKQLKLQPASAVPAEEGPTANTFGSIGWADHWVLQDTTMAHLAKFSADIYIHSPVLDRTGLVGAFDYRSPNNEDPENFFADQVGSFKNMIQEAGLRLTPTKGPVEYLVIDHAEKPSPN